MSSLVELYEFRVGEDVHRYTTRAEDILTMDQLWHATPLTRTEITQSPELAQNGIKVEFPLGHAFAMAYMGYGPDEITTLTVWRSTVADDGAFAVCFKGRVSDAEADDTTVRLICESLFTTLKTAGLRPRMQKFCRHVLYHADCGVDKALFAVASQPTAIDSRLLIVTCPEAAAFSDGWFSGGMLQLPSGALRYITSHAGDQIALWRPEPDLQGLAAVVLYPGCDGGLATCSEKFNNIDNNGAFYWIPSTNPHSGQSVF